MPSLIHIRPSNETVILSSEDVALAMSYLEDGIPREEVIRLFKSVGGIITAVDIVNSAQFYIKNNWAKERVVIGQ